MKVAIEAVPRVEFAGLAPHGNVSASDGNSDFYMSPSLIRAGKVSPGTLRSGNCGGNRGCIHALDAIRHDGSNSIVVELAREHSGIRVGKQRDG